MRDRLPWNTTMCNSKINYYQSGENCYNNRAWKIIFHDSIHSGFRPKSIIGYSSRTNEQRRSFFYSFEYENSSVVFHILTRNRGTNVIELKSFVSAHAAHTHTVWGCCVIDMHFVDIWIWPLRGQPCIEYGLSYWISKNTMCKIVGYKKEIYEHQRYQL